MFTATMLYNFKADKFEEACQIWEKEVLTNAQEQPGFIRLEFFSNENQALAIGYWEYQKNAQDFMATGVFKRLTEKLQDHFVNAPEANQWRMLYCSER
jgi:heme-degrading monooxygenase HmoA